MKAYRPLLIATAASGYVLVRHPGAWLAVMGLFGLVLILILVYRTVTDEDE